ncbi:MAG: glycosyltransferase family 2 protein [Candidatus Kerfeldbacteria bacterium]|nr:glycosyltransferase family 2 protein [Candidatus Kerfeldbacteria bacterium]
MSEVTPVPESSVRNGDYELRPTADFRYGVSPSTKDQGMDVISRKAEGSKFSVIIVSWNVRAYLKSCLESINQERLNVSLEVVVIDNSSSDGSAKLVRAEFPWVKLWALPQNVGFARACNLGAKESVGVYVVFLNPDTEVAGGFFSDLERAFVQHPGLGAVGARLMNDDGSTQASVRAWPTLWPLALDTLKLLNRWPWLARHYLQSNFDYSVSQPVEQVMGACLAVPRKVWQEVGGFDQGFFVWFEEVDWCKRASQAGYKVWYEANLTLSHSRARSFSQLTYLERHNLYTRSLLHYARKHLGLPTWAGLRVLSSAGKLVSFIAGYVTSFHR